jgi:dTDP-4-amino-4,6-dideoxygalactose transaminase
MDIPLVDLAAQHSVVADDVRRRWDALLASTAFVLGQEVATFEEAFAQFCGVGHCVGVGNGGDGLELALRAVGVAPGDRVVVPANSFVATAFAVMRIGAVPTLVDVDPVALLLDVERAGNHLDDRTAAIVPVHLYGQVAPLGRLRDAAAARGIPIVEDAAQAQGAARRGVGAGNFGLAAATSFYPGKNLGAYGDAGAVLTNAEDVATRVRALRNYGSEVKYEHAVVGYNSRLDALQAAVLNAKLPHLRAGNAARAAAAQRYDELLSDVDAVTCPVALPGNEHVWHLYVVRVPRRDEVLARLHAAGIGAGVHYPIPIHLQRPFRELGHREGDFPVTESAAREILSLPLFPQITAAQQERVVDVLREALR